MSQPRSCTITPSYGDTDRERFVTEDRKSGARTDFERDRARILHSAAFRRLGAKTQVMGPSSDDFIRTRLTHSLEVAQVGREIGKELGADPDVVDTACLAHDLGHPPFGHNGERALNELAHDCGGFEGNAQTFRLLTRLEPKVIGCDDRPAGVNLTRASLDAVCKYPWTRGGGPNPEKSQVKYSVYPDDEPVFAWMRASLNDPESNARCLEAQIMDLSDDIAYCVHDVEDAVATMKFAPGSLSDDTVFSRVVADTHEWYGSGVSADDLDAARQRLAGAGYWLDSFTGSYSDRARLKDLTSQLIGRFCSHVVAATRAQTGAGTSCARYGCDLVIPPSVKAEIQLLKGIAVHFVMAPREMEPIYLNQRTILGDLVDVLMATAGEHLEYPFAQQWRENPDTAARLRVVIDQVASLTDTSAMQWHARLCGMVGARY